jgi:SRSO17 transposase
MDRARSTPTLMRRDAQNQPQSAEQLAKSLPADAWRDVAWREGVDKTLRSRFAGVRVRPAHRDYWRSHPYAEEWLLVEWPQDESAPTKYWLSTLPADTALATLVETAKLRWRIERDYQELKQELGLDHYEGRGWRGFHHHMALCVAAYGFLVSERSLIPPSDDKTLFIEALSLPSGYRPCGSADPNRTPRHSVNRKPPH